MKPPPRPGQPVLRRKLEQPAAMPLGKTIGLAVAGLVGVAVLGLIVCASVPSIDLFGIYAARTVESHDPTPKKPAAPVSSGAPRRTNQSTPDVAPPVAAPMPEPMADPVPMQPPPDETGMGDDEEPPEDPAGGEKRNPETDFNYLSDLKPVELPATTEVGEATLSYLYEAGKIQYDGVSLLSELATLEEGVTFQADQVGMKRRWSMRAVKSGESSAAAPVLAEMWAKDNSLMFQWKAEAAQAPAAEQLRNAVVKFSVGSLHRLLPLRKPVAQPVFTLDITNRTTQIAARIAHPPRAESIQVEILGAERFPVAASYKLDKKQVPVPTVEKPSAAKPTTPAPRNLAKPKGGAATNDAPLADDDASRVVVLFDKFSTGQEPQLWIDPKQDGAGMVEIAVSAVLMRGKLREDLTPKSLELFKLPRTGRLTNLERDLGSIRDRTTFLDKEIGGIKANATLRGAAAVKARADLKRMTKELAAAEKETKRLEDEIKRVRDELAWVTFAENLIQVINKQAQLQYRVFAKSGDMEVDLVRGGID